MKPQILAEDFQGKHNLLKDISRGRIERGNTYREASTICVIPTRGMIHAKVVQSWMGMMSAMNQKFTRFFMIGMEVGEAYNQAIQSVLNHPELKKWKYVLTLEEDNLPPPDGLLKLLESIKDYDVVGGLYWTKGEGGQPMIYGDPYAIPLSFVPQVPVSETIQRCNGLGMGFTLFRMNIFRDSKVAKPWFKTLQEYTPGVGVRSFTQDLYFFENIHRLGYKVACDTRVKVGHFSVEEDVIW